MQGILGILKSSLVLPDPFPSSCLPLTLLCLLVPSAHFSNCALVKDSACFLPNLLGRLLHVDWTDVLLTHSHFVFWCCELDPRGVHVAPHHCLGSWNTGKVTDFFQHLFLLWSLVSAWTVGLKRFLASETLCERLTSLPVSCLNNMFPVTDHLVSLTAFSPPKTCAQPATT